MGFGGSPRVTPLAPPPPPPQLPDNIGVGDEIKKKLAGQASAASNIATSAQGVTSAPNLGYKSLLGS